eukprot:264927-Prymnesium_polylepis.1
MVESRTKREGLLVGALRGNPQNAPFNLVESSTPDGKPIRALGVPIGNEINEYEWWLGKYRE